MSYLAIENWTITRGMAFTISCLFETPMWVVSRGKQNYFMATLL